MRRDGLNDYVAFTGGTPGGEPVSVPTPMLPYYPGQALPPGALVPLYQVQPGQYIPAPGMPQGVAPSPELAPTRETLRQIMAAYRATYKPYHWGGAAALLVGGPGRITGQTDSDAYFVATQLQIRSNIVAPLVALFTIQLQNSNGEEVLSNGAIPWQLVGGTGVQPYWLPKEWVIQPAATPLILLQDTGSGGPHTVDVWLGGYKVFVVPR